MRHEMSYAMSSYLNINIYQWIPVDSCVLLSARSKLSKDVCGWYALARPLSCLSLACKRARPAGGIRGAPKKKQNESDVYLADDKSGR
jgi:hypothetical protein